MAQSTRSMGQEAGHLDWQISREKIDEVVRRIVEAANPLRVIAFGSWARGEHGPDSDIDLAVILDDQSDTDASRELRERASDVAMAMDILTVQLSRFERFRYSVNSVHYDIANEGIVLYERSVNGSASGTVAA